MPALALRAAVVRLLPCMLRDAVSPLPDSFSECLLEVPNYSRPEQFEGEAVPQELLSGHHARLARWRREQALAVTAKPRPDLIVHAGVRGMIRPSDAAWTQAHP